MYYWTPRNSKVIRAALETKNKTKQKNEEKYPNLLVMEAINNE